MSFQHDLGGWVSVPFVAAWASIITPLLHHKSDYINWNAQQNKAHCVALMAFLPIVFSVCLWYYNNAIRYSPFLPFEWLWLSYPSGIGPAPFLPRCPGLCFSRYSPCGKISAGFTPICAPVKACKNYRQVNTRLRSVRPFTDKEKGLFRLSDYLRVCRKASFVSGVALASIFSTFAMVSCDTPAARASSSLVVPCAEFCIGFFMRSSALSAITGFNRRASRLCYFNMPPLQKKGPLF